VSSDHLVLSLVRKSVKKVTNENKALGGERSNGHPHTHRWATFDSGGETALGLDWRRRPGLGFQPKRQLNTSIQF